MKAVSPRLMLISGWPRHDCVKNCSKEVNSYFTSCMSEGGMRALVSVPTSVSATSHLGSDTVAVRAAGGPLVSD